ncbi:MAG: DUF4190 domain-containing protein [Mycobacterium sp.]
MTAGSGNPGEKSQNEGQQPPSGGYEPPPIEQTPAYGGYPPPPPPPAYGGYPPYGPPPGADPYQPIGYAPPPEYGAPYPTGYGYPAQQAGTNSLAIFSLVASVVGLLCGVGSIVGIVLGSIAISQIKKTRQGGYGLAVAGIVVGVASLVISIVWMTNAFN